MRFTSGLLSFRLTIEGVIVVLGSGQVIFNNVGLFPYFFLLPTGMFSEAVIYDLPISQVNTSFFTKNGWNFPRINFLVRSVVFDSTVYNRLIKV